MQDQFSIVIVSPGGYQFSETFRELAETLQFGFRRLGKYARIRVNELDDNATNVILGGHLLDEETAAGIPENSIIYNFEQVYGESKWIKPIYVDLVRRLSTWDYSRRNMEMWTRYAPGSAITHVPVGYVPELTRVPALDEEDIDVLFYGVINQRRAEVLNKLMATGMKVVAVTGKFGQERDGLIARAKVVLNLHFFPTKILELPRISYLLANRKAVVSELDPDTEVDEELRDAVISDRYENLVDRCVEYVFDDELRKQAADRGYQLFARRTEESILRSVLAEPIVRSTSDVSLPARLNVGSGKGWNVEALNLDVDPQWRPDFVADLNRPLPLGERVDLGRFGTRLLPGEYFEEVFASHVLEHVDDLVTAMRSILCMLREGGILSAEVPYDLSHGAWQDPTHVRGMNERSWIYFTDWYWYLGWSDYRFHLDDLQYVLSEYGQELAAGGKDTNEIVRIPRAIDAMRVRLRKVRLTEQERGRAMQRWRN